MVQEYGRAFRRTSVVTEARRRRSRSRRGERRSRSRRGAARSRGRSRSRRGRGDGPGRRGRSPERRAAPPSFPPPRTLHPRPPGENPTREQIERDRAAHEETPPWARRSAVAETKASHSQEETSAVYTADEQTPADEPPRKLQKKAMEDIEGAKGTVGDEERRWRRTRSTVVEHTASSAWTLGARAKARAKANRARPHPKKLPREKADIILC